MKTILKTALVGLVLLGIAGYFMAPGPQNYLTVQVMNKVSPDETVEGPNENDSCITRGSFLRTNLIAYPGSDVEFMTDAQVKNFIDKYKEETKQNPEDSRYEIIAVLYPSDERDPLGRVNMAFFINGCMYNDSFEMKLLEWYQFNEELKK